MNVEETIKHLGNHWDLYRFVGNGERSFDAAKRFLMEYCEKPESTARAKMNSFKYTKDSLIKISSDGKRYSIYQYDSYTMKQNAKDKAEKEGKNHERI